MTVVVVCDVKPLFNSIEMFLLLGVALGLASADERFIFLCSVHCLFHYICMGWILHTLRVCDTSPFVLPIHCLDDHQPTAHGLDGILVMLVRRTIPY